MENVILNSAQTQIKIVDFGLSNVWAHDNPLRTHCGSPEYAAPELFIAGKEYGPEVDLWSLGIIFYGMVVGQLPFDGGRKNQLTSQERRKRLVAQINKGLGSTQKQAIAPLSAEFRTMLNKLLIAEPSKRMTIRELLLHSWITEKGRKYIQKHPYKELDNITQTKITKEISKVFQIQEQTVSTEILKNPHGRLGGMFNILKYKEENEHFTLDHISPTICYNSKNESKVKTPLAKSQQTLYNECIVLLNKVSKQRIENRTKSANPTLLLARNVAKLPRSKTEHVQTRPQTTKTISTKLRTDSGTTPRSIKKTTATKPIETIKQRPQTTEPRAVKRSSISAMSTTCKVNNRNSLMYPTLAGTGDGISPEKESSGTALRKLRLRSHLANEPIARSIVGYLSKNVPDRLLSLQKMRK